jgi:DNA-directed RNA polymerase specialized sigma24 family protein
MLALVGTPMDDRRPWWADDPDIAARRRRVVEELERAERVPIEPDKPDPVLADILSGASVRELSAARDDLARARARYTDAVRGARAAGLSWGEIGRIVGVSKQQLHRRFGP